MPVMFSFYRFIRCIISAVLCGSLLVIVVACMSFAFCQMINKEIIIIIIIIIIIRELGDSTILTLIILVKFLQGHGQ